MSSSREASIDIWTSAFGDSMLEQTVQATLSRPCTPRRPVRASCTNLTQTDRRGWGSAAQLPRQRAPVRARRPQVRRTCVLPGQICAPTRPYSSRRSSRPPLPESEAAPAAGCTDDALSGKQPLRTQDSTRPSDPQHLAPRTTHRLPFQARDVGLKGQTIGNFRGHFRRRSVGPFSVFADAVSSGPTPLQ